MSCNISLVMVDLTNKFGPFGDVGGSNLEVGLGEKSGDNEYLEKESKKELEKEKPFSSVITPPHTPFKI